MANISGLLGTAGGFKGTGVDAPSNWVDNGKLDQANVNLQNQFSNQAGLLAALQGQNGLANQTSVYNQLQGVANGTGPNPAQAQLAQATGANTANQAALMAGQRGSSQNTGLIARQAAMQGGANQQQSAGQAATLQAQQSLGALGQLGGIANQQVSNQIGQTNTNQAAAQANLNSLLTGNANQNAIKSGLITATAQQQASGMGSGMNAAGSAVSSNNSGGGGGDAAAGAGGGKPEDMPRMAVGGGIGKFASMFADGGPIPMAVGGGIGKMITMFADGGATDTSGLNFGASPGTPDAGYAGQSKFGQFLANNSVENVAAPANSSWGTDQLKNSGQNFGKKQQSSQKSQPVSGDIAQRNAYKNDPSAASLNANVEMYKQDPSWQQNDTDLPANNDMPSDGDTAIGAEGGKVPALLSPGEKYLTPEQAKAAKAGKVDPMKAGKTVPGTPKVGGAKNSYANDFVKADLEKGGLVLPRSVTQSKHPHWAAMKFVHAHMMANGGKVLSKPKSPKGKK